MNDTTDSGNMLMTAVEGDKFDVSFEDGEHLEDVLVTNVEQDKQYDRRVVLNNNEGERHTLFVEGRGLEYRVFALVDDTDSISTGSVLDSLKPAVVDDQDDDDDLTAVMVTSLSETGKDIEYAMENSGI